MDPYLQRVHVLDQAAGKYRLYFSQAKHTLNQNLPFLIGPRSLALTPDEAFQIQQLGPALAAYYHLLGQERSDLPQYIFLRPDILLTERGPQVCEIETSIFGFALALFLQKTYEEFHEPLLLGSCAESLKEFSRFWRDRFQTTKGRFIYTSHSQQYAGQLQFLAELLQTVGLEFTVESISQAARSRSATPAYRCFYLHEQATNPDVARFCARKILTIPSSTNFYEGKKPLALFQNAALQQKLSPEHRSTLQKLFLPTWIINPEVPSSFPTPLKDWLELAELPKGDRMYVLKRAGNHPDASWSRSVFFLHTRSHEECRHALQTALYDPGEWVIQPFYGNTKREQLYSPTPHETLETMKGRVRLTPYYSLRDGSLLTMKSTMRKDTLFIHGASDSINSTVKIG